jgi:hypothetical protein
LDLFLALDDFLDVIWSLPAALMSLLKLIINTWLGIWLLSIARKLNK